MKVEKLLFASLCLILLAGACASKVGLSPAEEASKTDARTAVSAVKGVDVTVETDAWSDTTDTNVEEYVTPLRVTIENYSGADIRIQYSEFSLESATGKTYGAIPPVSIDEKLAEPIPTTAFEHRDFFIAPYYSELYPNMTVYENEDLLHYDAEYYEAYYAFWKRNPKPTLEMLQNALPEGVLNNGGRVSGFLYFELVGAPENKLWFRANLIEVTDGESLGTISIPFDATQESLTQ